MTSPIGTPAGRFAATLAIALLVTALLAACGRDTHDHTAGNVEAEDAVAVAVYQVRGVVNELPPAGEPREWVLVEHEAIPDFIGIDGELDPMHAMTMRFPIAPDAGSGGLAVGDKITFELEIDWNAGEMARVLSVSTLPAETELELGGM